MLALILVSVVVVVVAAAAAGGGGGGGRRGVDGNLEADKEAFASTCSIEPTHTESRITLHLQRRVTLKTM